MKNILKISAAAAAMTLALSGCIKDATPTQIATEDQVTLETLVRGIPAALVMYNSTGYAQDGAAWDFSLPAIHLATESMTGDLVVTGNIGYDWFTQWGTNVSLGSDYAVGALTWDNYYTWIMMANNVIKQIDASDFSSLDATQRSYLGFAYTYRAMFYLDLVRLYEFKENTVTEAPELLGLGVPVVLPETTEAEAKNNPRAKVDDIYDKVIFPDLDNAEEPARELHRARQVHDQPGAGLRTGRPGPGSSGARPRTTPSRTARPPSTPGWPSPPAAARPLRRSSGKTPRTASTAPRRTTPGSGASPCRAKASPTSSASPCT